MSGETRVETGEVFAFNPEVMRPACVLIAAAMGANPDFAHEFPSEDWIVDGPEVEGIKRFGPLTRTQVKRIAERTRENPRQPASDEGGEG